MSGFEEIARTVILLGGVLTALTAIGIFTRRAWRKLTYVFERIEATGEVADAQLRKNGGSSLVDKVDQVEKNHRMAELHWTALEDSLAVAQDIGERRWVELAEKADAIAADLLEHRASVTEQHRKIIGRLDTIEARLP